MKDIIIITLAAALMYVVSNPFIRLYRGIKAEMERSVDDGRAE